MWLGLALACDPDDPPRKHPTDSDADADADSDTDTDTDADTDTATHTGAPPPLPGGDIVASVYASGAFGTSAFLGAYAGDAYSTCAVEAVFGACTVLVCDQTASAPEVSVGDGWVTVDGVAALTFEWQGSHYLLASSPTPVFVGGEWVEVGASGADGPAFTVAAAAPSPGVWEGAAVPPDPLPLSEAYLAQWTPYESEGWVTVTAGSGTGTSHDIRCLFDPAAGEGEIPLDALGRLEPGRGYLRVSTNVVVETQIVDDAGLPWDLQAWLTAEVLTSAGLPAGWQVQWE
ncbi:MAG: hypothetical protein ABMA64_28020 [Myxococcota bacterium]